MEAVARQHGATWGEGSGPADAWLRLAGRRVAVTVRSLDRRLTGPAGAASPHLRFDRVVKAVAARLRAGLGEAVPEDLTVVVTITAPIRLAARTAAALEERVRSLLRRPSPGRSFEGPLHGNLVSVRLVADQGRRAPRVMTLVHNPGIEPRLLSGMVRALLALPGRGAPRPSAGPPAERWLVAACASGGSHHAAYRQVDSLLRPPPGFARRFLVLGDGSVGELDAAAR